MKKDAPPCVTPLLAGRAFRPDMKGAAPAATLLKGGHGFSRAENAAAKAATSEGVQGKPSLGFPSALPSFDFRASSFALSR